jgi:hypothetical protein
MSLWDVVAGISTSETLKDHHSKWKKINSVSLDIINGDGLAYTNEGGYTWNIFGVNVNFVCDFEALLEGAIASTKFGHALDTYGVLGAIFGPGANNNIIIGNSNEFKYMVGHSNNFSVVRGNPEFSIKYSPWQELGPDESPIVGGFVSRNRHKLMWLAISAFALLVAGFDIALNILKNKIEKHEIAHEAESSAEKKKDNEEQEGRVINPDAGGKPAESSHAAVEELEDAEPHISSAETTLKNIETTFEWTLFSNIIAENRGIWLLKFLEQLCAVVKTVKTELEDLTNTVVNLAPAPGKINEDNKASVQQEIENITSIIEQLEKLGALPQLSMQLIGDLWIQTVRANNVKEELKKKIKDYEDAARQSEQLSDVDKIQKSQ